MLTLTTLTQHYPFLLFTVSLYLLTANLSNGEDISNTSRDQITVLLSFKAAISDDPLRSLSNWNSSTTICSWTGITCSPTWNSSIVTEINLVEKNISGQLPPSLFHLPNLRSLNLSGNQLFGSLPSTAFSSSSSLVHLNLSSNNLTGSIPSMEPSINSTLESSIIPLSTLDLSNNYFTGEVDQANFSRCCRDLTHLDLGGNILVGEIPNSITLLSNLQHLTLASNQLSGKIPPDIGRLMTRLKWVYLGYNNLSGEIPASLGELTSLEHLDLVYNNLTGVIPHTIGKLTGLRTLFLYGNNLHGAVPPSIFSSLRNLTALDLSSNNFLSGEIPETISQLMDLEVLQLFSNNFTGRIPSGVTSLPKLRVLQLWKNRFSGEIPADLGKRNNLLTVLDLSTNFLTGKLPENLCGSSGKLSKLILFSNDLEGPIPESLGRCRTLERVRLMNNRLSGDLPKGLMTALPAVNYMDLSSNRLTGRVVVGNTKWAMPELQMLNIARNRFSGNLPEIEVSAGGKLETLDLSENRFSGRIPPSYGRLSQLMELNVSGNVVSGEIPGELVGCKKMVRLDLSRNRLSGVIPRSLGELPVLGELDLYENQLEGDIPVNLGAVDSLVQVNLSHNHLRGPLPSTSAFLAINHSAVAGNELCGGDPATGIPACSKPGSVTKKKGVGRRLRSFTWWSLLVASFIILVLAASALSAVYSLIILIRRRRNTRSPPHSSSSNNILTFKTIESQEDGSLWEYHLFKSSSSSSSSKLSIQKIISALLTNQKDIVFINSEVDSARTQVMVESQVVSTTSMEQDGDNRSVEEVVTQLSRVRHRNLLRILGVCRSAKGLGLFLIYELPAPGDRNGSKSLSGTLHGLSWEQRGKVALGVAKALRYLHHSCSPAMLVGDLSPERILVDGDGEGLLRLSIYPKTPWLGEKWFDVVSSAYFAPETKTKANPNTITTKNDIYGFGVLLIELLTGKSPTTIADPESASASSSCSGRPHELQGIVEWARHCYSHCHLEIWIDPVMQVTTTSSDREQMVELIRLALRCTTDQVDTRPAASDVVKTLESGVKKMNRLPCVN